MLHAINEWCAQRDILQLCERLLGPCARPRGVRLDGLGAGHCYTAESREPRQITHVSLGLGVLFGRAIQDVGCLDPGRNGGTD